MKNRLLQALLPALLTFHLGCGLTMLVGLFKSNPKPRHVPIQPWTQGIGLSPNENRIGIGLGPGACEGYVMLSSFSAQKTMRLDTPQGKVVLAANLAEMEWSKRPKDEKAKIEFEKWVDKDGPYYDHISKRIGRYINGGHYLVQADHDVTVTKVDRVDEKTYRITTVETTHIVREDGIEWSQVSVTHTYKVVLEGKNWKVFSDDF